MRVRPSERGAALLAVLILVGVLGALAAGAFDRLRLAMAMSANAAELDRARAFTSAAEALATARIDDLVAADPSKTTDAGGWQNRLVRIPLPGGEGLIQARVADGGNCFNLNSVVSGSPPQALVTRPTGLAQFVALAGFAGLSEDEARRVAGSLADWIDSDSEPNPGGAEDSVYAQAAAPYRTGGTLLAEVSELRAVANVTPDVYARLRPWLCALPTTALSPVNVNTLSPARAALVAMMLPGQLRVADAQALLAVRPAAGWDGTQQFWDGLARQAIVPPGDVVDQPQLRTRYFTLDMTVAVGDSALHETALIDATTTPSRLVLRRWSEDE